MNKKHLVIIFFALLCVFAWNNDAQAGFGISPPYVKPSKPIFAGSHYEQQITLLRSSADADMEAVIQVNAPEIMSWVSIDKGEKFDLPRDQLKVPMVVRVDVPSDAEIGPYKGHINIRIVPKKSNNTGGVAIALGARVEIDLSVTDESFVEFNIRKVEIPFLEELAKPWKWKIFSWFFYRIKVNMLIENTGNTKIAPSKVHIDIYDNAQKKLLESHDDKSIKKVAPFRTSNVTASFPTNLTSGEYWTKISIYKGKDIIQKNQIIFTVYAHGDSPEQSKLGIWPYIMFLGLTLLALLIILLLIKIKFWRYLFIVLMFVLWPLRFILGKTKLLFGLIKRKFWRWMHAKAAMHQEDSSATDKDERPKE